MVANQYGPSLKDLIYNKFHSGSDVNNLDFAKLMQGNQPDLTALAQVPPQPNVDPSSIVVDGKVLRQNSFRDALGDSLLGIGTGLLTNRDAWQGLGQGLQQAGQSMDNYRNNNALYQQALADSRNRQAQINAMGQSLGIDLPVGSGYMSQQNLTDAINMGKTMSGYKQKQIDQNLESQRMANTQSYQNRNLESLIPQRAANTEYLKANTGLLGDKFALDQQKFEETKGQNKFNNDIALQKLDIEYNKLDRAERAIEIRKNAGMINKQRADQELELIEIKRQQLEATLAPKVTKINQTYNSTYLPEKKTTVEQKVLPKGSSGGATPRARLNLAPLQGRLEQDQIQKLKAIVQEGDPGNIAKVKAKLKSIGVDPRTVGL